MIDNLPIITGEPGSGESGLFQDCRFAVRSHPPAEHKHGECLPIIPR